LNLWPLGYEQPGNSIRSVVSPSARYSSSLHGPTWSTTWTLISHTSQEPNYLALHRTRVGRWSRLRRRWSTPKSASWQRPAGRPHWTGAGYTAPSSAACASPRRAGRRKTKRPSGGSP